MSAEAQDSWSTRWIFFFIFAHPLLALLMKNAHVLAGIHALVVLVFGVHLVLTKATAGRLAQWMAYVVGAEVLWRMCKAPIPWEFGKYSLVLAAAGYLLRSRVRPNWLPILYLVLLLPAVVFTFVEFPLNFARKEASFYLSGPACLAFTAVALSRMHVTEWSLRKIGISLLAPLTGIAFLAFFRMATTDITFGSGSSADMSGGYGPNQVSAMLGLGAVVGVFLYMLERRSWKVRLLVLFIALWFLGQAALTFSRTGLYLFAAAIFSSAFFLVQSRGRALKFLKLACVVAVIACSAAPILDAFTGGQLAKRYQDKTMTGRESIAAADMKMFFESPIIGNGIGISMARRSVSAGVAAHTEYTRLLAEHGLLGAAALVFLFVLTATALFIAKGPMPKALVAAFAAWAFLFMTVSAMRLAAPAFLLGFIQARFHLAENLRSAGNPVGKAPLAAVTGHRKKLLFARTQR